MINAFDACESNRNFKQQNFAAAFANFVIEKQQTPSKPSTQ